MRFVLSPAKSLDFESALPDHSPSDLQFAQQAQQLVARLKPEGPEFYQDRMSISDKLAQLNYQRMQDWHYPFDDTARAALFAFNGDVYSGLDAYSLDQQGIAYAQAHLRILSGLYGLLRPLDRILPYRLEMGTKLETKAGSNLYQFWGSRLAKALNEELKGAPLVNLASNEYFKAVDKKTLTSPIIEPVFKDYKNGQYKVISFFAKKARGAMVRWAIDHQVTEVDALKDFGTMGYQFSETDSSDKQWIFLRKESE